MQYQFILSYSLIKKHCYTFVLRRNKLRSVECALFFMIYDSSSSRVQNRTALLGVANVKSITFFFWNLLVSIFHSFSTLALPLNISLSDAQWGAGSPYFPSFNTSLSYAQWGGGGPLLPVLKHFIVWCLVHVEGRGGGRGGWRFAAHVTVQSKLFIKIDNVWHLSIDWDKISVQPHTCIIYIFWLYSL